MQDDLSHRRHAIQVVASLPEEASDALLVLELSRQLVLEFLKGDQTADPALERDRGRVVSLSSSSKGRSF
jgi:hypothetical protein